MLEVNLDQEYIQYVINNNNNNNNLSPQQQSGNKKSYYIAQTDSLDTRCYIIRTTYGQHMDAHLVI
jgi:hypothetical protein